MLILGLKIEADEVEKFISSNCQEINKDKWLCPLSGKKFKAPDFIRKHIFNKFSEKVEEVKLETQYYNNYIKVSLCVCAHFDENSYMICCLQMVYKQLMVGGGILGLLISVLTVLSNCDL